MAWLLASTSLSILSPSLAEAACPGDHSPVWVFAGPNDTCNVTGDYISTTPGQIAMLASGSSAVITWPNGGEGVFTIGTTQNDTPAVKADTGGSIALAGGSIVTGGAGAAAALAGGGGTIDITGGTTIETFSDNSPGLAASGSAALLMATDVGIKTHGVASFGATVSAGGAMTLTDSNIGTFGQDAHAVFVSGDGSRITITGVQLNTSGFEASGVVGADGGAANVSAGSINTTGNGAYAVLAEAGVVSLSGTTIGTTGDGSGGLGINGAGSEIDAANASITTTGGLDSTSGLHAYGVYNGPFGSFASGGVAKLTDTSVSTQGVDMHAVITNTGGSTTILGGSIATAGSGANAILSENGGATLVGASELGPTTVTTSGSSAAAAVAYNGGSVQLTGATVTTSGDGSAGLSVDGATSSLSASGVSITNSGRRRFGHRLPRRWRLQRPVGQPRDGWFLVAHRLDGQDKRLRSIRRLDFRGRHDDRRRRITVDFRRPRHWGADRGTGVKRERSGHDDRDERRRRVRVGARRNRFVDVAVKRQHHDLWIHRFLRAPRRRRLQRQRREWVLSRRRYVRYRQLDDPHQRRRLRGRRHHERWTDDSLWRLDQHDWERGLRRRGPERRPR